MKRLVFLTEEEINIVCSSIQTHGSGKNATTIIGSFLAISDKIDMCKSRTLGISSPIQEICSYDAHIQDKNLKIFYELSSPDGKKGLYMIPKSIDVPFSIGTSLGLKVEFYNNKKLEEFLDRDSYHGYIYSRR